MTCTGSNAQTSTTQRPIILIVFDDLFDPVDQKNLHGVTIHTPNFDRLAAMGVRFENAFASVAVCNPSRSSFMTGQSPFRTTIQVPEPVQWNETNPVEASVVFPIRQVGYDAVSCGKVFHNQTLLHEKGFFDEVFNVDFQHPNRIGLPFGSISYATGDTQADDVHVQWAVDQLNSYQPSTGSSPLFLSVGILRPHKPFIAPQAFFDLYPASQLNTLASLASDEADLNDVSDFYKTFRLLSNYHNNLLSEGQAVEFVQAYLACTSYADSLLGELLDAFEANEHLADATIIVTSDNGYQLGEKQTWNKFTLWEESAKVPLYVVDPSLTPSTTCNVPVTLLDLAPTMTAVAGATPLPLFDGHDLIDIAKNPSSFDGRVAITQMIGSISVRDHQYRLILYNDGSMELYDINADPQAQSNLVPLGQHTGVISQLITDLSSTVQSQGAVANPLGSSVMGTSDDDILYVIGNQMAAGGAGNDIYFIADGGQIQESGNGGYDTSYIADTEFEIPLGIEFVRTSLYVNNTPYMVEGNSEPNRVLVTSARAFVNGNEGDDVLLSGNPRDQLDGGPDNDLLLTTGGHLNQLTGGTGIDVVVGAEGEDLLWGNISSSQLDEGISQDESGDFIVSNELYWLLPTDQYLPSGELLLTSGIVVDPDKLPLLRKDGSFFYYGKLLEFSGGENQFQSELNLNEINTIFSRYSDSDFFLLADGQGDQIWGGLGDDAIFSGQGNDIIESGGGNDFIQSIHGDDNVDGGNGNNMIYTGPGNDFVSAGAGDDQIDCGEGDDEIKAGGGHDRVYGRPGQDWIKGQSGNDLCSGGDDSDLIEGGVGDDILSGNAGDDTLVGQGDDDLLFGGLGNDFLIGGNGDDTLFGQGGDDELLGGPGDDVMEGGSGADRFWFPSNFGVNSINDFNEIKDSIAIPNSSIMHGSSDQEILDDYTFYDGWDTWIVDGWYVLILRNIEPSQLLGRLIHQ